MPIILVRFFYKLKYLYIFEKYSNVKFNANLCNGSRGNACRQTHTKELILHFRNFAIASKVTVLAEFILLTRGFLIISF